MRGRDEDEYKRRSKPRVQKSTDCLENTQEALISANRAASTLEEFLAQLEQLMEEPLIELRQGAPFKLHN